MSRPIISVRGLGKRYRLGATGSHDTLRDHIAHGFKRLFHAQNRQTAQSDETFWALKDVSFDINEGEVVGVIGRNGAGKSTLLKILSQITEPTEGEVRVRGRIASLLEVGTGFHPELSGRENIFLNGAILGMSKAEIRRNFDEIVAFAEVEKFLDTPVKRYSSGMYVRLAFAVAAHLEPEILIVDEVLSVGDAAFQTKCMAKMSDVSQKSGRTVVFVSHNLAAVQRLCGTGIYLESGCLKVRGPVERTLDAYQRAMEPGVIKEAKGNPLKPLNFHGWEIAEASEEKHACFTRDTCNIQVQFSTSRDFEGVFFGFALWNLQSELMAAGSSYDQNKEYAKLAAGTHLLTINVRLPLKAALYQIQISMNSRIEGQIGQDWLEPKLHILPLHDTHLPEKWHGLITEPIAFTIDKTA